LTRKIKILITGASGFIGQNLLEHIDFNKFDVRIITRDLSKVMRVKPDLVEVYQADLTDLASLKAACCEIDCLINIAAEVRNQSKQFDVNVLGTKNLIEAVNYCNVKKVIHISSVGVVGLQYSNQTVVVDENAPCSPKNGYEQTKKASEDLFLNASKQNNFNLIILRPTNVFGEYHPFNALLNLFKNIEKNSFFFCEKNAIVNYLYVQDLTDLICYLIDKDTENRVFNVGESMLLSDFVKHVSVILNKEITVYYLPKFLITFINVLGIHKLRSLSNQVVYSDVRLKSFFKYPFSVNSGLKKTITFYKAANRI
jgi:nucleoside-diphosphate-sugar epimerase